MNCSKCSGPNDRGGQAWCRSCHAAYMRDWRAEHPAFLMTREMRVAAGTAAARKGWQSRKLMAASRKGLNKAPPPERF